MNFYMPVRLICGDKAVEKNAALLSGFGKRCLIVTGGKSAVVSGALADVTAALEKEGLIERSRVASDDRLKKIVLTESGRAITDLIRENCRQLEETLTRGFSPEEFAQLQEYLDRMQHNLTEAN